MSNIIAKYSCHCSQWTLADNVISFKLIQLRTVYFNNYTISTTQHCIMF